MAFFGNVGVKRCQTIVVVIRNDVSDSNTAFINEHLGFCAARRDQEIGYLDCTCCSPAYCHSYDGVVFGKMFCIVQDTIHSILNWLVVSLALVFLYVGFALEHNQK